MEKGRDVGVVKNFQVGRKKPRVDLRAERVGVALRIPGRVVGIKVPKDEGGGGRRQVGRVEGPSARDRRGAKRGDIDIQKRKSATAEVNLDPKKVR